MNISQSSSWIEDAVFYEIYPQSFYDSNGDGIGDLQGIIEKLDYVAGLGVTAIWLNPFYRSPMRDAGYDVADYCAVDPRYGTSDDARRLFEAAHERGLRVIVDFVPGHTSVDHPWFVESCKHDARRPERNWYIWTPSVWDSGGGTYRMLHGYGNRDGNVVINFFWHQPALNFGFGDPDPQHPWQLATTHPDVQKLWDEMKKVLRFWLEMGADGFRVDMAGSIVRRDPGYKETRRFYREVRDELQKDFPGLFMVAEHARPEDLVDGTGFDACFFHWSKKYVHLFRHEASRNGNENNSAEYRLGPDGPSYFDRSGAGDITGFIDEYLHHYSLTREVGHICIPLGNHDLSRIAIDRNDEDMEIIFAFLLTMPGVPFIYYGDEIGMRQVRGLASKEGAYRPRCGARTPMQWSGGEAAGFSTAAPREVYLPVDNAEDAPNVASQENRSGSLLGRVKKLISLRKSEPALRASAHFEVLYAQKNEPVFVYRRTRENEALMVVICPAQNDFSISFRLENGEKRPFSFLHGAELTISQDGAGRVSISGEGPLFSIYRV